MNKTMLKMHSFQSISFIFRTARKSNFRLNDCGISSGFLVGSDRYFGHRRPFSSSDAKDPPLSIGIRREGKNRWERRVPLVPEQVERLDPQIYTGYCCRIVAYRSQNRMTNNSCLVKELGSTVYIQPSTKRVIPTEKYVQAGAIVKEDLSEADIIMGVKEVPVKDLIPKKTYLFFSHTHKGQPYNMPMLDSILKKNIRLLDYELLTNEQGTRLVQFSRFAGYAGMVDGLHSLGLRLLAMGHGNPFLAVGMSYMYRAVADARLDVTRTGMVIADDGLPRELGPMIFVITGHGNVSKGALYILKCLPHEWVKPEDLEKLAKSKDFDNHKIYLCQVGSADYAIDKNGAYDVDRYFKHPEEYTSIFHEKIAPYASFILNGIFWTSKYPRLLTIDQTKTLALENRLRLITLADVSCDINGSFEFMGEASTIDSPYFMYDPITSSTHENLEARGIQIMSIDNLPTEMPLEASEFFSEALYPVVSQMVKGNFKHPVLARAAITTQQGTLEERHQGLYKHIEKIKKKKDTNIQVAVPKRILLLGSGFVAKPLVDYLLRTPSYSITIASNAKEEALELIQGTVNTNVVPLDVKNSKSLGDLVSQHDIVVSFVPATMHPLVAEQCLKFKKHMVTASYISPAMKSFHERAKQAGLSFVNEIGLDPGIDHLTACKTFDAVHAKGGKIVSFVSWCGGLPAPEVSDNPLGYKFSWSPRGVLLAGLNSATFKRDGKMVFIPGDQLLSRAVDVPIFKGFSFEGLANRDSVSYIDTYKLDPMYLETMFRGTLRYKGYSELMNCFAKLGLLNSSPSVVPLNGKSWNQVLDFLTGGNVDQKLKSMGLDVSPSLSLRLKEAIQWLDLNSSLPLPKESESVLDAFCSLLESKLVYGPNERDMVAMHHEFGIKWSTGVVEKHTSTMIAYGDPQSYSAMAKTVGIPAAICTDMVLSGHIQETGVFAPLSKDIYEPMIEKLEHEGIKFVESLKL